MPRLLLPQPISVAQFEAPPGPTYTQIFNDTLGAAATPADGFDVSMADAVALSDAFGVELNADPLGISLGAAAGAVGGVDPTSLDGHMADYIATKDYGMGIIAAAEGNVEPQLLTLPITPGDGSTAFLPPRQLTQDFGTVKLGSAPVGYFVGQETDLATGQILGISPKGFVVDAPGIFSQSFVEHDALSGDVRLEWSIVMTPATVGQWTAQYEYTDLTIRQLVILTLTVNVTP